MHITITGKLGSGKTTISHLISRELGYVRYSTGEYSVENAAVCLNCPYGIERTALYSA